MSPNLEARTVDSRAILITEHNVQKDYRKYPELFSDTPDKVRSAIETGKLDEIPPIVALQNPFSSIEKTVEAYEKFTMDTPRPGGQHYQNEDEVLKEILRQNPLLCYNGNIRLEEFQRARLPIRAFVITSQEEYDKMPQEERRIPEKLKAERPAQYKIDQNYVLSYLGLLDDVVYIQAEKRHWDSLDTGKLLVEMRERRTKRKES